MHGDGKPYRCYTGVRPLLIGETSKTARPRTIVVWSEHELPQPGRETSQLQYST